MDFREAELGAPSRLPTLLDRLAVTEDPRQPHRVMDPLSVMMLLAVCGTIADCGDGTNGGSVSRRTLLPAVLNVKR